MGKDKNDENSKINCPHGKDTFHSRLPKLKMKSYRNREAENFKTFRRKKMHLTQNNQIIYQDISDPFTMARALDIMKPIPSPSQDGH